MRHDALDARPRVDDVAGTIAIEATLVRVPGEGLIVQPHTKSDTGMRTITPPAWEVVAGTPWPGLHPHAFRHLVATRLDAAGPSAREIADYLGHERVSMTRDVYTSRMSTGAHAGPALDVVGPHSVGWVWGRSGAMIGACS